LKGKAAVLEKFHEPLAIREYEVQPLKAGEVLVEVAGAGVCGSDVHMWEGRDPRTILPIIPGHEGVGRVADLGGPKKDIFGRDLKPGDAVMWERGIMCGHCYYCVVRKQPALCPNRLTYGLSIGCADPPHFQGNYAQYLHLRATGSHMIKLEGVAGDVKPEVLVPATCSGATAASAVEQCGVRPGDTVVIQGPGPVGLFVLAFVREHGAGDVIVIGTEADKGRLELCREFGATDTLVIGELDQEERRQYVLDRTHGVGANVVLDCTGVPQAMPEGLSLVAPYGGYCFPGIATPVGEVSIPVFEMMARKNVRMQGVWCSDTNHLYAAIRLVAAGRYPFEKIVTHTFPLEEATDALRKMQSREAMKAVLLP